MTGRKFHILGVPLRTGSLYPGSENDADAYREAQLLTRLQAAGCDAADEGDLAIPNYLPHHFIPPIRNWPGPRIVWDCIGERIKPFLEQPNHIPLLIGCDCSIVAGTTQALRGVAPDVHVLYIDGDFDDAAPNPDRCQSAAAQAVWLLTNASPFWTGPPLAPAQVTVVGWTKPAECGQTAGHSLSLADVRRLGGAEAARQALRGISPSAAIVIHFDIDVLHPREMPAAYFPHTDGMSMAEIAQLLGVLCKDPRLRILEISEYAALRDMDRRCVTQLSELLCRSLQA
jgi:arginase